MSRRHPLLIATLLMSALVAACGGGGASTGGNGAPETSNGDMGGGGGGGTVNTNGYDAPEMAALMPTSVDGVAFTISSIDYSKIPLDQAAMSFSSGELEGWLGQTGKTWKDVRWVMANTDFGGSKTATVTALRVNGADEASMLDWFGGSGLAMGEGGNAATIGGKSVYKVAIPGLTTVFYYWTKGDTLYWATADPESFGNAVVEATK